MLEAINSSTNGVVGELLSALADEWRRFQETLGEGEDLTITLFLPSREIRLSNVDQAKPLPGGIINFFGEDTDGRQIDLFMHYTQLTYMVEVVPSNGRTKIGFTA